MNNDQEINEEKINACFNKAKIDIDESVAQYIKS